MDDVICRLVGHRWAPMVMLPADLCMRCSDVRDDDARAAQRRAEMLQISRDRRG